MNVRGREFGLRMNSTDSEAESRVHEVDWSRIRLGIADAHLHYTESRRSTSVSGSTWAN